MASCTVPPVLPPPQGLLVTQSKQLVVPAMVGVSGDEVVVPAVPTSEEGVVCGGSLFTVVSSAGGLLLMVGASAGKSLLVADSGGESLLVGASAGGSLLVGETVDGPPLVRDSAGEVLLVGKSVVAAKME